MFIFTEAHYQIFRNKARSVLLLLISAVLCGCVFLYIGNIQTNRAMLAELGETAPVTVHISNAEGSVTDSLTIAPYRVELLENWGVRNELTTSQARGALSPQSREDPMNNFDTRLLAVSSLEAAGIPENDAGLYFSFAPKIGPGVLKGTQGLCLAKESYMQDNGLKTGDSISMPVYLVKYTTFRFIVYTEVGELSMEIAGSFSGIENTNFDADIYLPINWLRAETEARGVDFNYSSFQGDLKEPMRLNEFKEELQRVGFYQPFFLGTPIRDLGGGISVIVDDKQFVQTAERLQDRINTFTRFTIPFLAGICGVCMLSMLLILRGSTRDMAISYSLGRPKAYIALSNFLAAVSVGAVSTLLVFAASLAFLKPPVAAALGGLFLVCAGIGDILGICLILRFDAMKLLLQEE